ncbi:MAG: hypothetical protein WD061_02090 [Candidatus Saccharimonadales bacterium]
MKKIANKYIVTEVFGWYGASAIILAYALVSFELVTAGSWIYQLLNLTGALGIITTSLTKKDYQPAVLNIFWLIIAAAAITRIILL